MSEFKFEQIKDLAMQYFFMPVWGPFKGFHILLLIIYILPRLFLKQQQPGPKVTASHILVKTEKEALDLKPKITPENFNELAKEHSTCPSKSKGGSLGEFARGAMVPEFDRVCFDPETEIGKIYGPVKTNFGFHFIRVDKVSGPNDKKED